MRRVLIIAGGLQIGGAEKVAANISKYAPDNEFEFHYLIFKGYDNIYGKEIIEREFGAYKGIEDNYRGRSIL